MHITTRAALAAAALGVAASGSRLHAQQPAFHVEEISIAGIHEAIQQGRTTCTGVVQAYLDRARAYNGVSNYLVTPDGASIPKPPGQVRAGAPLAFPIKTVAIGTLLPNFSEYVGPLAEAGAHPLQALMALHVIVSTATKRGQEAMAAKAKA